MIWQTQWRSRDETVLPFFDRTDRLTIGRPGASDCGKFWPPDSPAAKQTIR